jgi:UDP-glucose 4-epimerase
VYGPTARGCVVDEQTPPRPDTLYGVTKLEGEEPVLGAGGVVLRLAAVYGPSMKGNYPRLVEAIRRGRLVMVGDGRNRRTLVHVDDVCAAALLAAEHADARGRVYNVTDGAVHELGEVVAAIAAALGRRPPGIRLPAGPVRVAAGLLEDALGAVGRGAPVRRATIDKLTEDVAVSGRRIQEELGFRPAYELRAGWRQALGGETTWPGG